MEKIRRNKSAMKRIRQTVKRTARRRDRLHRIKTFVRKLHDAQNQNTDAQAVQEHFRNAMSEIHRGAVRGVIHKKKAARIISRLHKRTKLATESASEA